MKKCLSFLMLCTLLADPLLSAAAVTPSVPKLDIGSILDPRNELRTKLSNALDEREFQQKLQQSGVNPVEAKTRLAAMTNTELAQLEAGAQRQLGGDVVVVSASVLLLVLLIVLLVRAGRNSGGGSTVVVTK